MLWRDLLTQSIHYTYACTDKLLALVDDSQLGWKPATGDNWMTTGQLLRHISDACGGPTKGFVTGEWPIPEGVDPNHIPDDVMLPPAEKLPSVASVAEARQLLAEDKETALAMVAQCSDERLENEPTPAPWDPMTFCLGQRIMQMVEHLTSHKSQLFYYLKLQGKPVNTMNLWGM